MKKSSLQLQSHCLLFMTIACISTSSFATVKRSFCPNMKKEGVISLDFQPAFLHVDEYEIEDQLFPVVLNPSLTISSFFNAYPNRDFPNSGLPFTYLERDLVARLPNLGFKKPGQINSSDIEILTDQHLPLGGGDGTFLAANTIWPNDTRRVPRDVFNFEALVIPQGFHTALKPGRLSIVDLTNRDFSGNYPEYVVHQSGTSAENPAKFYHHVEFVDMNGDGRKDMLTSRSGFRVGGNFTPPSGDLVWFEQPENYDGTQSWTEHRIYQMPFPGTGPDIDFKAADLNGDGIVEIVAPHVFTGTPGPNGEPPENGKIEIYGVPDGFTSWSGVGFEPGNRPPKIHTVVDDQGLPFSVYITDLNRDGKKDILATNHQAVESFSATPGRVLAIEQPADSKLFESKWQTHVLLDGIRPYPNVPGRRPPGRLAPGTAEAFYPSAFARNRKPWILVSGDEAGKVWVLKPNSQRRSNWQYDSAIVFDINDTFGEGTSQTPNDKGVTISTIGKTAVRYNYWRGGAAELYIPVFEASEIHVLSMYARRRDRIDCVQP